MSSLPNTSELLDYPVTWNGAQNKVVEPPFIIGVAGGTASGKTSVCSLILKNFQSSERVVILSQDCFYKELPEEVKQHAEDYNFDHPNAFDWALTEQVFKDLVEGKPVNIPQYDFKTHSRLKTTTRIEGASIIIFEGILAFYNLDILRYFNMKIFVDTDADTRLARRILRDINERGRDLHGILHQYEKFVKPAFETYILPTKKNADVIIPRGADNTVAIDLIVQHIRTKLEQRHKQAHALRPPSPLKFRRVPVSKTPSSSSLLSTASESKSSTSSESKSSTSSNVVSTASDETTPVSISVQAPVKST